MTLELSLVCYTQVLHACMHNIQMAKAMTYHLRFIDELYHAIGNRFDLQNKEDKKKFEKIRAKYKKIAEEYGAEIKAVYHITRDLLSRNY